MGEIAKIDSKPSAAAIEAALVKNDLSQLTTEQRVSYYNELCKSLGLNPLTKPFQYLELNRKIVLYATRDATEQLRKIHGVSLAITAREKIEDVYVVTAKAKDKNGREDESTGAVPTKGLYGEALANAFMKAETKAKRRVTLSICGLGLLDETEVDSIAGAKAVAEASLDSAQEPQAAKPAAQPQAAKEPAFDPKPEKAKEIPNHAPATKAMIDEIRKTGSVRGWSNTQIGAVMFKIYGVKDANKLNKTQADELLHVIQTNSATDAEILLTELDLGAARQVDATP